MSEENDFFSSAGSTEGFNEDSRHKGGGKAVDKPGFYHVQVGSVDFESKENALPFIKITMVVLAGTHEDQKTRKIYHRIFPKTWENKEKKSGKLIDVDPDVFKGFVSFLYGFGVLTDSVFNKDKVRLSKSDYERLVNCQAIVEVSLVKGNEYFDKKDQVMKKGNDEHRIQWNNQVYRLNEEKVADVPKDHDLASDVVYRTGDQSADDLDEL